MIHVILNLWQKSAQTHMPTTSDTFECYGALLLETLELCGSGVVYVLFWNEPSSKPIVSPECDGHSICWDSKYTRGSIHLAKYLVTALP